MIVINSNLVPVSGTSAATPVRLTPVASLCVVYLANRGCTGRSRHYCFAERLPNFGREASTWVPQCLVVRGRNHRPQRHHIRL